MHYSSYLMGKEAFTDGEGIWANPYSDYAHPAERQEWRKGWIDACRESGADTYGLEYEE